MIVECKATSKKSEIFEAKALTYIAEPIRENRDDARSTSSFTSRTHLSFHLPSLRLPPLRFILLMNEFTESAVEEAVLEWADGLAFAVRHGPEIAPEEPAVEREIAQ